MHPPPYEHHATTLLPQQGTPQEARGDAAATIGGKKRAFKAFKQ